MERLSVPSGSPFTLDQLFEQKGITVYGASSPDIDPHYTEVARQLGAAIAARGVPAICGGGRTGMMAAVIEGAVSAGGTAIGVLPHFMIERAWHNTALTQIVATDSMHTRKETMARLSFAAIALPGGCGTFEELLEIITWRQLGLYQGHVIIFNINGYYDPLLSMLQSSIDQHFMNPDHRRLWNVVTSVEEAMEIALRPVEYREFTQKVK